MKTQSYYNKKLTTLFLIANFKMQSNLTFEQRTAKKIKAVKIEFGLTIRAPVLQFLTTKTPYKK